MFMPLWEDVDIEGGMGVKIWETLKLLREVVGGKSTPSHLVSIAPLSRELQLIHRAVCLFKKKNKENKNFLSIKMPNKNI